MDKKPQESLLDSFLGHAVVVDFRSTYVCLGNLAAYDAEFFDLRDADLHDFRDGKATREVYIFESVHLGIRRNRSRVLVRREEVVAVALLRDVLES